MKCFAMLAFRREIMDIGRFGRSVVDLKDYTEFLIDCRFTWQIMKSVRDNNVSRTE